MKAEFTNINEIVEFVNNSNIDKVIGFLRAHPEYVKYVENSEKKKTIIMTLIFTSIIISDKFFTKEDLSDPDIARAMVYKNPYSIKNIQPSEELCIIAVRQNGRVLEVIDNQNKTRAVCLEAIINSPWAIEYVPRNAPFYTELAKLSVRMEPDTIRMIDPQDQTEAMRMAALRNPHNIEYLSPDEIDKYSSTVIRDCPELVWMFPNESIVAVDIDGSIIANIHPELRTEEVCRAAVFSYDIDNIIPFIPMEYRDKLVNELISRIKAASALDESSKYYGFCTPYGSDEYDDCCDDSDDEE